MHGGRSNHRQKRRNAHPGPNAGHAKRVIATPQHHGGQGKAAQCTRGQGGGQGGGAAHTQLQNFSAKGFEQHLFHVEGHGAKAHRHQTAHGVSRVAEGGPGGLEGDGRVCPLAVAIARLLLPQGGHIEHQSQHRTGLDHLHQAPRRIIGQRSAKHQGADDGAQQQHHAHQAHHFGLVFDRGQIGGQGQAHGLGGVQARTHQQKRHGCTHLAHPGRGLAGLARARQHQQGKRHHRQTAKLQQSAHPDVGHAAPAQFRAVVVRAKAYQRPKGREQQRNGDHHRYQGGADLQLHNHDAVECAHQQHQGHADGDLKQRQAQQARERQIRRSGIGKRQKLGAHVGPCLEHFEADAVHACTGWRRLEEKRTEIKDLGSLVETDESISWLPLAQQPLPQQVLCRSGSPSPRWCSG